MKSNKMAGQYYDGEEYWETPSLAWIHNIRREMDELRRTKGYKPQSRAEFKKLVEKLGLKYLPPPKFIRLK